MERESPYTEDDKLEAILDIIGVLPDFSPDFVIQLAFSLRARHFWHHRELYPPFTESEDLL